MTSCTGRGVKPPQPYLKEWDEQIVRLQTENRQLRTALETSTTMMEAMMVQMHSWEIEPAVNVRGQMAENHAALVARSAEHG